MGGAGGALADAPEFSSTHNFASRHILPVAVQCATSAPRPDGTCTAQVPWPSAPHPHTLTPSPYHGLWVLHTGRGWHLLWSAVWRPVSLGRPHGAGVGSRGQGCVPRGCLAATRCSAAARRLGADSTPRTRSSPRLITDKSGSLDFKEVKTLLFHLNVSAWRGGVRAPCEWSSRLPGLAGEHLGRGRQGAVQEV